MSLSLLPLRLISGNEPPSLPFTRARARARSGSRKKQWGGGVEEDGTTSYGIKKEVGSGAICLFMIPSHSLLSSDMCHYPAGRPQIKFSLSLGPHAGPRLKISGENIGYSSGFQRGPLTKTSVLCIDIYRMKVSSTEFWCVSTQLVLPYCFIFILFLQNVYETTKNFNDF